MRARIKSVAVIGAIAMLAAGAGMIPANARHNQDIHSRNARKLARKPIKINDKARAEGSDLAFQRRLLVAGSYQGTGLFRMRRTRPHVRQIGFHHCPGSQGDVSIWKHIVFVSIDSAGSNDRKTRRCNNTGTTGARTSASSQGKEGIRVVNIRDRSRPRQVGFVETTCGSHTHTLVPHRRWVYMYVDSYPLGTGGVTQGCDPVTFHKFSILRFPKRHPARLRLVGQGPVPNGSIGCHDTTVYPKKDIAVAACLQNTAILNIENPAQPRILSTITNPSIEVHHSSAITWDGKFAIVSDEHAGAAGGGGCEGGKDGLVGEMWFYKITRPRDPVAKGHYQLPRQPPVDSPDEAERYRCTTHNYNIIPMRNRDRYVAVSAYYTGGWSMVDFSRPSRPREMAYYLPLVGGKIPDMWSAYWYNGRIYSNEHSTRFGVSAFKKRHNGRAVAHFFAKRLNPQTQIPAFRN